MPGGTGKNNEKELVDLFLKKVKGKILYIPIAMENKAYGKCYEWVTKAFPNREIDMLVDFKMQHVNLSDFSGILIGGGNTFKLLKELKESGFDKKLMNFKGVIYGGSAGTIIWGKTIGTASFGTLKDKNKVKLKDLKGMNKVKGYDLQCHYYEKEKKLVEDYVKKNKTPVIALPDDCGVYVKDGKIKEIGKIYFFER